MTSRLLLLLLLLAPRALSAEPLAAGTHDRVPVAAPTRLDWVFALSNQSPARPPAEWTAGYTSTDQTYRLLVPGKRSRKTRKTAAGKLLPLVLFISPGDNPGGFGAFAATAARHGVLVASPRGAGNRCPFPRRVNIVLDVLDDLRRRFPIDPDRTYLAGFSGGGRVACTIGFALPELFGGVISFCAAGDLRSEPWLRHRVQDRLSVALVTGETDFNRGEVQRFRGPLLSEVGVRTRVWVEPGTGHAVPAAPVPQVFEWLEADRPRRAKLATAWPASRIAATAAGNRQAQAAALLAEANKRIAAPGTLYSGLMQLKGIRVRWTGLPEAQAAEKTLLEYDSRDERPWEKQDIAQQRRFLVARARGIDAYGSGPLPSQYAKGRADMLKFAITLWDQVLKDGQDTDAVDQARKRIPVLRKRLAELDKDPGKKPDKKKSRQAQEVRG